ncbi:metallophosphoesterase family protein [Ramlibacter sp. AN1133]|uniref:metallophosphoesterase family protein n=1 Tax=Ramlibacter sp. AN1133 TaxID=3133429 RepID=UPI0030BA2D89
MDSLQRRKFLRLSAYGGMVFSSGLPLARAQDGMPPVDDFYFVQLSDTHWGYQGDANPDASVTLPKAVDAVNALPEQPDFVVFTGDLTHTTDDPRERRKRMSEFRDIVSRLRVASVRFLAGEHDAALDQGRAFREFFGPSRYTFDHKGIHFIALDNVSDAAARLGDEQLSWLAADIERQPMDARIVVLAHRPLFDLYPQWDWATRDGARAVEILQARPNVTVFYGHIHQEHHHSTGHIAHHSARSLIFPLPAPGSQPKRAPLPWDGAHPYAGLGFREVEAHRTGASYELAEFPVVKAST